MTKEANNDYSDEVVEEEIISPVKDSIYEDDIKIKNRTEKIELDIEKTFNQKVEYEENEEAEYEENENKEIENEETNEEESGGFFSSLFSIFSSSDEEIEENSDDIELELDDEDNSYIDEDQASNSDNLFEEESTTVKEKVFLSDDVEVIEEEATSYYETNYPKVDNGN